MDAGLYDGCYFYRSDFVLQPASQSNHRFYLERKPIPGSCRRVKPWCPALFRWGLWLPEETEAGGWKVQAKASSLAVQGREPISGASGECRVLRGAACCSREMVSWLGSDYDSQFVSGTAQCLMTTINLPPRKPTSGPSYPIKLALSPLHTVLVSTAIPTSSSTCRTGGSAFVEAQRKVGNHEADRSFILGPSPETKTIARVLSVLGRRTATWTPCLWAFALGPQTSFSIVETPAPLLGVGMVMNHGRDSQ